MSYRCFTDFYRSELKQPHIKDWVLLTYLHFPGFKYVYNISVALLNVDTLYVSGINSRSEYSLSFIYIQRLHTNMLMTSHVLVARKLKRVPVSHFILCHYACSIYRGEEIFKPTSLYQSAHSYNQVSYHLISKETYPWTINREYIYW